MVAKSTAQVVIDSREPDDVVGEVSKHHEVDDWYVDTLEIGDLLINKKVLVERKTVSDFASSILEGRLRNQAERMMESEYEHSFIMIEGDVKDFQNLEHTNIKSASLRGAMASCSVRYGVTVIPVSNLRNLIDLSVRIGRKAVEDPPMTTYRKGMVESKDVPQTVRIIAAIDGVGETAAWNLYSEFGSVERILQVSIEEMKKVPNIGEKRAEVVKSALSSPQKTDSGEKTWTI